MLTLPVQMAHNPYFPAVNGVIPIHVSDINAQFTAAHTTIYSTPLYGSSHQTYQRTQLLVVTGLIVPRQEIHNIPEDPVSSTTGNWQGRHGQARTYDEMTSLVYQRCATYRRRLLKNLTEIVEYIVLNMGGSDVFAAATSAQNMSIFWQFYYQDLFSIARAMFNGCGADVINLDAIFNGRHRIPIGQNTGFDQIAVLLQWIAFLFTESCQIVGRWKVWESPSNYYGAYEVRRDFAALRPRFFAAYNNPQGNNPPVHILDPRNMPV